MPPIPCSPRRTVSPELLGAEQRVMTCPRERVWPREGGFGPSHAGRSGRSAERPLRRLRVRPAGRPGIGGRDDRLTAGRHGRQRVQEREGRINR